MRQHKIFDKYMRAKYGPKKETITVTRDEFIALMVATGRSQKDAEMHAKISKIMGSGVEIGDKIVCIKDDVSEDKG